MWKKSGLLIDTNTLPAPLKSHAAVPFAYRMNDTLFRIFFASRDEHARSHAYSAELDFSGAGPALDMASIRQVMGLGDLGAFDDSGVMPSWAVTHNDQIYLYYTGWSLGRTVPFYNFIGLAGSADGGRTFERLSQAPILGRSPVNPFLTNSPCVLKEGDTWKMWYVSGKSWKLTAHGPRHYYFIRYAHSSDGIDWIEREEPCIDFASDDEYAIARPSVVPVDGGYLMWYSYRGESYRIGLAASEDGIRWHRADHKAGLDVSDSSWDSQMVAFSHVFHAKDAWWMLYNGNDYGKTGVGLATTGQLPALKGLL